MSDQFKDQLKLYKKKHGIKTLSPKEIQHRKPENLSQNDIRELMGEHRPTYKRGPGGAIRQK